MRQIVCTRVKIIGSLGKELEQAVVQAIVSYIYSHRGEGVMSGHGSGRSKLKAPPRVEKRASRLGERSEYPMRRRA